MLMNTTQIWNHEIPVSKSWNQRQDHYRYSCLAMALQQRDHSSPQLQINQILKNYAFVPPIVVSPLAECNHTLWQVQTGAGDYVLKISRLIDHDQVTNLQYEHAVINHLSHANLSFHVPIPLPNQDGETISMTPQGTAVIVAKFPGVHPHQDYRTDVTIFSEAIGELHSALQNYPTELIEPHGGGSKLFRLFFDFSKPVCNPFTLTPGHIGLCETPSNIDLLQWWREEEAVRLHELITTRYQSLPQQVCWNDVSTNNSLLDQKSGRISAIFDFEHTTVAARALDVAAGLRAVMRVWKNPSPWDNLQAFLRGYSRRIRLTEHEIHALPWLISLRSIIFLLRRLRYQQELERIPFLLQRAQAWERWFEQHKAQFFDVVWQEIAG